MYKFLLRKRFSVLLYICLRKESLDHIGTLCLNFKEITTPSSKQLHHFPFSPAMSEGSDFSAIPPTLYYYVFLIIEILCLNIKNYFKIKAVQDVTKVCWANKAQMKCHNAVSQFAAGCILWLLQCSVVLPRRYSFEGELCHCADL